MAEFFSQNPANEKIIWKGEETSAKEINYAVGLAKQAFSKWSALSAEKREEYVKEFAKEVTENQAAISQAISEETGKPLWESKIEVDSMIQKVFISIEAKKSRCPDLHMQSHDAAFSLHHKPHGVISVFGPFNFPGHLPNGHIVPALLAGNTVIYKSSEKTPAVSEHIAKIWQKVLPDGVVHLVHGGPSVGQTLLQNPDIQGFFFTGSLKTGLLILESLGQNPEKILALEMGGNNPLILSDVKDIQAAVYTIIQSAFLTSGQRCTCARRLIMIESDSNYSVLQQLIEKISLIKIGAYTESPQPFMGPVISLQSMQQLLQAQEKLTKLGGRMLVEMKRVSDVGAFLSPGLMDMSDAKNVPDEEFFGPFLQLYRVKTFEEAIEKANETQYGLAASLLSHDREKFHQFYRQVKAGILNWNQPTTGASSRLPFGGVKKSGNYRPSAYYAADYSAYPVATIESPSLFLPKEIPPGVPFL